ncbi:UvrD-helicase domain-containing protein [Leptospira sp. 'Mane']|uniref:UvrD-helicase domain-containing protein n=1 Tax=Leptospira sp. 'Mane' TaxID=3387407 RepID=UPI00398B8ADE
MIQFIFFSPKTIFFGTDPGSNRPHSSMWNEEQLEIIESKATRKQVIAAAGSGKTSTMIGLLEEQERRKKIRPDRTLIVTFTNKATDEFRNRTIAKQLSNDYNISTFHAFCFQTLRRLHPHFKEKGIQILTDTEKDKLTRDILTKHRLQVGGIPFSILFSRGGKLFQKEFPEVYENYQNELLSYKQKEQKFEFDDLISLVLSGLESEETWTKELLNQFDSVIVDEFQDTDWFQLRILKKLNIKNTTIVGDDWQAIYGFRGATPEPFLSFPEHFPDTKIFQLCTNYRSLKGIIDLSVLPIGKNKTKIQKQVKARRQGEMHYLSLVMKHPKQDRLTIIKNLKPFFETDPETVLLVRSNFRRREWIESGISPNKVMTIHASKGLEFGTVITDISSGWNLTGKSDENDIEEERRILYVALSRAKDRLILLGKEKSKTKKGLEDEFFRYFPKPGTRTKGALRLPFPWGNGKTFGGISSAG